MVAVQQMLVLFAIMVVGFIARKVDYTNEEVQKKLSAIVLNIANPALILSSVADVNKIQWNDLLLTALAALITYVFLIAFSYIVPMAFGFKNTQRSSYQLMFVFNNVAFMGFPIISALYGSELLIYSAVFVFFFNVLIYTFGIQIISREFKSKRNIKEIIKKIANPGVISCLIAFVIILFRITLHPVFNDIFSMLGHITAPISMMCIGASLVGVSVKGLVSDYKLILYSLLKLIAMPILVMFVLKLFITNPNILNVSLINIATPVASITAMLAQKYDGDIVTISKGVTLSTILSLVTIPLMTYLLGS